MFVTFETAFENTLEDVVVLDAEGPHGEDFVERYGIDLVTQIIFDLLQEEREESDQP